MGGKKPQEASLLDSVHIIHDMAYSAVRLKGFFFLAAYLETNDDFSFPRKFYVIKTKILNKKIMIQFIIYCHLF